MQCPISHQSINGECVMCDGLCPKGTMRVGGVNRCIMIIHYRVSWWYSDRE